MGLARTRLEHGCASCPLNGSPARWVAGDGPDKVSLVIVGEAPGENEAVMGRPFVGRSGQLLNATLKMAGIDRKEVYATNSVMCPIKPRPADLSSCRGRLFKEILRHDPVMVLTVGKFAFQSVCESRTALSKVEGTLWYSDTLGLWVLPTWHPAAALRTDTYYPAIVQAIMRVGRYLDGTETLPTPHQEIHFPWTFFRTAEDTLVFCRYYRRKLEADPDLVVEFGADTESRSPGKRPHPEGDLWLMLQTFDGERGAAIDMTHQSKLSLKALSWLFRHPRTRWYFHNGCTYDTRVLRHNAVSVPSDDRIEDTLVYGLGLSELGSRAGLEPLARTWLNAPAYKRDLYDKAGYKHAKGPQNEAQWYGLARYGVTDAYLGYHLQRILPTMVDAEGTLGMCNRILKPLALTCGRIAHRGLPVDREQIDKLEGVWGARLTELEDSLDDLAFNAGFPTDERVARLVAKNGDRFNPRSHIQLAHLAFDILGLEPTQGLTNRKFRACVPLSTQILTRNGWKKHDEVSVGDETIGYNPQTDRSEWTRVTGISRYEDAEVWRIGGETWNADVTPEHRWWYYDSREDRSTGYLERTSSLKQSRFAILLSAYAETPGELELSINECHIIGWLLSDGHVRECFYSGRGPVKRYRGEIVQGKPDMLAKIRKLLLDVPHTERLLTGASVAQAKLAMYHFRLSNPWVTSLVERSGLLDPITMVLAMSSAQRSAFLESFIDGDGHRDPSGVYVAQNAGAKFDAVVIAAYLAGYRPTIPKRNRKPRPHRIIPQGHTKRVHLAKRNFKRTDTPSMRYETLPSQPVWCPETELGTWTACEDNGVPFLTGNSKWHGGDRARSCDADFLLGHDNTEFAPLMRYLRTYDKLLRTYVRGLAKEIDPDGLIHPEANIAGTLTGRLVWKPLLQVMPQHGAHRELAEYDFAKEVRRIFPARPGMVILAADFKQLEFRVAWALSGDVELGKALMSGDMHATTARYMFQRDEVDDHDRHAAKRVGFGVAFNRSSFTLSRGPLFDVLGGNTVSDEERQRMAQDYIDKFWGLYSTYYDTQQGWMDTATKTGELRTPFGRVRRWMLITYENRHEIRNQASNYVIQSTASDMMSLSLVDAEPVLAQKGLGYPLYTVHDQLITEIYEDKIDEACQTLFEIMTKPRFDMKGAQFDITFEVGKTLGDVEKYDGWS